MEEGYLKVQTNAAPKGSNLYQYLAAFIVNFLALNYGIAIGWPSSNVVLLLSNESPLPTGKVSKQEASWIVGFICVGGFIGNLLFGYITERFGRKKPLLVIAIPGIVSWLLVLFGQNVYYLYISRLLIGVFGGGIYAIVPNYLSEIACDRIRGVLGSTVVFSCNIGILLAFVLGNYCEYYTTPKVAMALLTTFLFAFSFFPDPPSFFMKKNQTSQAKRSIQFYRHIAGNPNEFEILQTEMNKLEKTVGGRADTTKPNQNCGLKCSDFAPKQARKAMIIGIALVALNQFCGCFAMLNYTASIFKESGSSMSPNMSAIVVGTIQLVGSYCPTVLVDRAGRRFLFAVSAFGTAFGLISLGTYSMLKSHGYEVESFNWVPICSFSFTIFIASWGVLTLPFLVISEVMPEKLKNFGSSFCMSLLWIFAFTVLKFLPLLSDTLGMHGTMFLFSSCSLLGALFVVLVMPETKGKSYEEIMQSLR